MAKIKITAPNGDYTGVSAGVGFAKGVGHVDESDSNRLDWFRNNGYTVADAPEVEITAAEVEALKAEVEALKAKNATLTAEAKAAKSPAPTAPATPTDPAKAETGK